MNEFIEVLRFLFDVAVVVAVGFIFVKVYNTCDVVQQVCEKWLQERKRYEGDKKS